MTQLGAWADTQNTSAFLGHMIPDTASSVADAKSLASREEILGWRSWKMPEASPLLIWVLCLRDTMNGISD